jgi:hypothetical protein
MSTGTNLIQCGNTSNHLARTFGPDGVLLDHRDNALNAELDAEDCNLVTWSFGRLRLRLQAMLCAESEHATKRTALPGLDGESNGSQNDSACTSVKRPSE